jgi:hypothetical protein
MINCFANQSIMSFSRLLSALLIAALCGAAMCQILPSSCNACTDLNRDVYGRGRPSVVWCSATPPLLPPSQAAVEPACPPNFSSNAHSLYPAFQTFNATQGRRRHVRPLLRLLPSRPVTARNPASAAKRKARPTFCVRVSRAWHSGATGWREMIW